jgi:hypothetical protein
VNVSSGMKVLKRNMRNGIRLFLGWKMGFHALHGSGIYQQQQNLKWWWDLSTELSYITGGPARDKKVSAKTWRILYAISMTTLLYFHGNCHWPTAILSFRRCPQPPLFLHRYINNIKIFQVFCCFLAKILIFPSHVTCFTTPVCFACGCSTLLQRN